MKELLYHINDLLKTVDNAPVMFGEGIRGPVSGRQELRLTR
ncbi:MAG: hypothetical protein ACLR0U_04715 [Enterocloster clostridioformis]